MPKAQHSSESCRWFTPPDIVERARRVLGTIDLDPCTEEGPALETVRPSYYLDEDGETTPWAQYAVDSNTPVRCLVNPPGGAVVAFWDHLMRQWRRGEVRAVWIGFSLQQLQVLQNQLEGQNVPPPTAFLTCLPSKRLGYTRSDGYRGSPPHASYITCVGADPLRFSKEFGEIGDIVQTIRRGSGTYGTL